MGVSSCECVVSAKQDPRAIEGPSKPKKIKPVKAESVKDKSAKVGSKKAKSTKAKSESGKPAKAKSKRTKSTKAKSDKAASCVTVAMQEGVFDVISKAEVIMKSSKKVSAAKKFVGLMMFATAMKMSMLP